MDEMVPNSETVAAMKAARRSELVIVGPPSKLVASLIASDKNPSSSPRMRGPGAENR